MTIIGAASADPDATILGYNAGEGAAAGALIGAIGGTAIGGLTALFKHSKYFTINGNPENWQAFRNFIAGNTAKN